ncbi:MAG: hypoxanthine phosphoribosyltransferase [Oscillospiraceae bacterium]|jgi:hypoxanthine phosphoribosyltransferase|nr:hypoxanthine phosphoribosyltransferase [Oscillospiraceae bacterium]
MTNDISKVLISEQELDNLVTKLANQINLDYNGKELVLIGLLKGSVVFMTDLIRKINLPCTIDFISVSSYGDSTESTGRVKINFDVSQSVAGKHVVIVEDIIDSGNTISYMLKYFDGKGAESVKICTLLDKPDRRVADIEVDYSGTIIPDEFVVGYGLDYAEKYRNLPYVGILNPNVYS